MKLQVEKENKFLDMCWMNNFSVPTLIVLTLNLFKPINNILILQNEQLLKSIELDTSNLNVQEAKLFKGAYKEEENEGNQEYASNNYSNIDSKENLDETKSNFTN